MRAVVAVAGMAAVAYAARRYLQLQGAMTEVAAELRSPILYFTAGDLDTRSLGRARLGTKRATKTGPGVTVAERVVDSELRVRVLVTTPGSSTVGQRRPAVLLIHGGAMVVGSPEMERLRPGASRAN